LVHGLMLADPRKPAIEFHGQTTIANGRLIEVNTSIDNRRAKKTIDCSGCLIMPGLVNAHTHGAMSMLRGLADDLPLDKWLNQYIFPSEAKYAGPEFVYLGTLLSAVEMALGGITTFADAYFFMEKSANAAAEVGLRIVVAQGILDVPSPDAPEPNSWPRRVDAFLSDCPSNALITPALFCHSPYLCSPNTFKKAREISSGSGLLLFTHVSESLWEVEEINNRYGFRPVEHLYKLGILDEDFVAVHAVHLDENEKKIIVDTGAKIVHCPECNMKLASGAAPAWDLAKRGATIALGTDGPGSNNNLDLFEEMRSASLMSKLVTGDPEAMKAAEVVRMATIDGAKVLGLDERIGTLEVGKQADLIVIDFRRPHLAPVYDPISHLVYSARGSDVRHVIVNGKVIVQDSHITTIDINGLLGQVNKTANRIAKEIGLKIWSRNSHV